MISWCNVSVVFCPSSRSPSTRPPRTPILLRRFEPPSASWHPNWNFGWRCMLPAHTRNTDYKTGHTCTSEEGKRHSAYGTSAPPFPPPCPPHLLTTLGSQSEVWRFLFSKRDIFLFCTNLVLESSWVLDLQKSGKKDQKKELLSRSLRWSRPAAIRYLKFFFP